MTGSNSNTEIRTTSGEMRYSVSWLLCISGHGGRLLSPGCSHHAIVLQVMSSLETSPIALCEYYEPDTILMTCINTRESTAPFNSTSNFASFYVSSLNRLPTQLSHLQAFVSTSLTCNWWIINEGFEIYSLVIKSLCVCYCDELPIHVRLSISHPIPLLSCVLLIPVPSQPL